MVDWNTNLMIHVLLHGEASQSVDFLPPRKDNSRNLLLVVESKHFWGSIKMQQCNMAQIRLKRSLIPHASLQLRKICSLVILLIGISFKSSLNM